MMLFVLSIFTPEALFHKGIGISETLATYSDACNGGCRVTTGAPIRCMKRTSNCRQAPPALAR
jgi:hypothetical protein